MTKENPQANSEKVIENYKQRAMRQDNIALLTLDEYRMFIASPQDTTIDDVKAWIRDRIFYERRRGEETNQEQTDFFQGLLDSREALANWIKSKAKEIKGDPGVHNSEKKFNILMKLAASL